MKNITYGYANERAGLIYTRVIRMEMESETHYLCSCACAVLTTAGNKHGLGAMETAYIPH